MKISKVVSDQNLYTYNILLHIVYYTENLYIVCPLISWINNLKNQTDNDPVFPRPTWKQFPSVYIAYTLLYLKSFRCALYRR